VICNLSINPLCTNLQTAGRETFSKPDAIVLIALGNPLAQYDVLTNTPTQRLYPTSYPKSVHFVVGTNGIVSQYVETQNTAWGIDALHNPTWPGIQAAIDPASQFLFIGLEGNGALNEDGTTALAHLLCCLSVDQDLELSDETVIVARDINDELTTLWNVPDGLIALAQSICLGGQTTNDLVRCCNDNTARIVALEQHVEELDAAVCAITADDGPIVLLQNAVTALQSGLTELQLRIATLETTIGSSAQQFAQLAQVLAQHQVCIDNVCPPENRIANIEYYGTQLPFTALTPNWLNPTIKVSDTVPPSVMTGPMWTATLATEGTYLVEVRVRFAIGDWCAGRQAWLDLVINDGTIRLHTVTVSASGTQSIELVGSTTIIVPPTAVLHISAQSNDSTSLARLIDLAWIKITRLGQ